MRIGTASTRSSVWRTDRAGKLPTPFCSGTVRGITGDGTPFVPSFIGDTWTEAELLAIEAYDFEEAT